MNLTKSTTWTFVMFAAFSLPNQMVSAAETVKSIRVNVYNGQAIYNEGKGAAMACGGCHGAKALGIDAMGAPRLANISQKYILKQLDDYAAGKRNDPGMGMMMVGIASAMNEQDRHDVAAYLDTLAYETEPSDLKSLAEQGNKIGNPEKGKSIMMKGIKPKVPACHDCHGFSGRAQNVPAIHQQKYTYLVNQLNRYRDGSRANDHEVYSVGIMRGIAKKLSDSNIADISAYLATVTDVAP